MSTFFDSIKCVDFRTELFQYLQPTDAIILNGTCKYLNIILDKDFFQKLFDSKHPFLKEIHPELFKELSLYHPDNLWKIALLAMENPQKIDPSTSLNDTPTCRLISSGSPRIKESLFKIQENFENRLVQLCGTYCGDPTGLLDKAWNKIAKQTKEQNRCLQAFQELKEQNEWPRLEEIIDAQEFGCGMLNLKNLDLNVFLPIYHFCFQFKHNLIKNELGLNEKETQDDETKEKIRIMFLEEYQNYIVNGKADDSFKILTQEDPNIDEEELLGTVCYSGHWFFANIWKTLVDGEVRNGLSKDEAIAMLSEKFGIGEYKKVQHIIYSAGGGLVEKAKRKYSKLESEKNTLPSDISIIKEQVSNLHYNRYWNFFCKIFKEAREFETSLSEKLSHLRITIRITDLFLKSEVETLATNELEEIKNYINNNLTTTELEGNKKYIHNNNSYIWRDLYEQCANGAIGDLNWAEHHFHEFLPQLRKILTKFGTYTYQKWPKEREEEDIAFHVSNFKRKISQFNAFHLSLLEKK